MVARRRTSPAEDLFEIAAMLPWWAGLGLAVVIFILLHGYASTPVTPPTSPSGMVDFAARSVYVTLAKYGQWILPIPLLIGAAVSAYKRRKRAQLHADVAGGQSVIEGLTWQEFEMLVGEAFRQRGFSVLETGGGGADGGVDLVLSSGREKYLVQCKQWKALRVGVTVVRELYGVMAAKGATGGFVVTSGQYSPDAMEFTKGRHIDLIDGPKLAAMIQRARKTREAPEAKSVPIQPREKQAVPEVSNVPKCPKCAADMVRRIAKKGVNAGKPFWGCGTFPKCHGTRPI